MEIVLSMTLGVTLLLIILVAKHLKENFANIFLISLLGLVALGCTYVISLQYINDSLDFVTAILNSIPALFGSLTYLYVKYSIFPHSKFKPSNFLHFVPFILAIPLSFYDIRAQDISIVSVVLNVVVKVLVSIVYFILALKTLAIYRHDAQNHFSNSDEIDLKWLKFIVVIGLFSYLVYFVIMLFWMFNMALDSRLEFYSNLLVFIFIIPISYYGLTYTNVFARISAFSPDSRIQIVEAVDATDAINDLKNGSRELISPEKASQIFQELLLVMNTQKLYLNENLMLEDLARELNQHSRYLSYVINAKAGKTFYDFINYFRVIEFNRKLTASENKNLTFLAIAFECGFGSKSSFNRAYKSEMGISPSEYLRKKVL